MLNNDSKKCAIEQLTLKQKEYEDLYNKLIDKCIDLYEVRKKTSSLIMVIEGYINMLANTPKSFECYFEEIQVNVKEFTYAIELENDSDKFNKVTGMSVGTAVAAGATVAAFAPTVAMAIATTFGTASTGAAISALSGAAATNAALAWIGGGTLLAGGGGIAGGSAILALAGPVGWIISGGALLTGVVTLGSKNKKIAEEANEASKNIEVEIRKFHVMIKNIEDLNTTIQLSYENLSDSYIYLSKSLACDYLNFTDDEKYILGELVNSTKVMSELLNERVN